LTNYFAGEEYEPVVGSKKPKTKVVAPVIIYTTRHGANKRATVNNNEKNKRKRGNRSVKRNNPSVAPPPKFMSKPAAASRTNVAAAVALAKELNETPLYFINGHACICPLDGPCLGDEVTPFFPIQLDTYLLTFGTPTDFSCLSEKNLKLILHNAKALKDFLYLHSSSDMIAHPAIGVTRFSFFGDLKRATQKRRIRGAEPILYPNLAYSFNPDKDAVNLSPEANPYGVYRLDTKEVPDALNNTHSIIPQDAARKNWFLQDIIKEVYAKTGIPRGIFLNGGCLSSCIIKSLGPHMTEAARLMEYAHSMYPTIRETLTSEEALSASLQLPTNIGTLRPFTYFDPKEAAAMVRSGLYNAKTVAEFTKLYHPENTEAMAALGRGARPGPPGVDPGRPGGAPV